MLLWCEITSQVLRSNTNLSMAKLQSLRQTQVKACGPLPHLSGQQTPLEAQWTN